MDNNNSNNSNPKQEEEFDPLSLQVPNLNPNPQVPNKQDKEDPIEEKQNPEPEEKKEQETKLKKQTANVNPNPDIGKEDSITPLKGLFKIMYIILFVGLFAYGTYFIASKVIFANTKIEESEILLQAPYQPVNWKGFGNVFEPILKLSVVYPNQGVEQVEFLLDSGALVSSLPREEAKKMGYDSLADLQRSTFRGYGGTSSFAYKGDMTVLLNNREEKIPVVFTEAQATKKILGRSGFFQKYSIHFNAKKKIIEIRE